MGMVSDLGILNNELILLNWEEVDDTLQSEVLLPGIGPDGLIVTVVDDILTIEWKEIKYLDGTSMDIFLPVSFPIKKKDVSAKIVNGVLTIVINNKSNSFEVKITE